MTLKKCFKNAFHYYGMDIFLSAANKKQTNKTSHTQYKNIKNKMGKRSNAIYTNNNVDMKK